MMRVVNILAGEWLIWRRNAVEETNKQVVMAMSDER
jgi:hypothetical protein